MIRRPSTLALAALAAGLSLAALTAQAQAAAHAPAPATGPAVPAASPALAHLQSRWAEIKYATAKDAQPAAFERLTAEADAALEAAPRDAALLTWRGIIEASWAGAKGGLGALPLVKKAKADFEAALAIDETALDGSAHTSLGSLYYQVPGWPVGFGDDDAAREHLQAGLRLNPDGLDSNFFWADFLRDQGEDAAAAAAFRKALAAPPRAGRASADAGRRAEITAALAALEG
jgi:tetratricopeptide (TPR) repeat protein